MKGGAPSLRLEPGQRYRDERGRFALKPLDLYGSHEVAKVIVMRANRLTDDELREVLREEWTRCEANRPFRKAFVALFRKVGYVSDSNRVLHGELTIYRGNAGEAEPAGIAWTISEDTARWFGEYCFSPRAAFVGITPDTRAAPTVWRAKVDAGDVLGYFEDRKEAEVVVDPATLRDCRAIWRDRRSTNGEG